MGDKCDWDADGDGIPFKKETGNCTEKEAQKIQKKFIPCLNQNLTHCSKTEIQYNICFQHDNCYLDANEDQKNR